MAGAIRATERKRWGMGAVLIHGGHAPRQG